ncbi:hypothetical protein FMEAI12_3130053 [Parafrankia sp. Ea1.12]|nr:hypothetical protein FMEAI12_3130053 [Parafrankia sp. Ea1.12]
MRFTSIPLKHPQRRLDFGRLDFGRRY